MRINKLFYVALAVVGLQALGLSALQLNTSQQRQAQKRQVENLIKAEKWQDAASGIAAFDPGYPRFAIDLRDFFVESHTPKVGSLTYDKTLLKTSRGRQQIKKMILKKLEDGDFESARAGIAALPEQFKRDLHKSFVEAAVAAAVKLEEQQEEQEEQQEEQEEQLEEQEEQEEEQEEQLEEQEEEEEQQEEQQEEQEEPAVPSAWALVYPEFYQRVNWIKAEGKLFEYLQGIAIAKGLLARPDLTLDRAIASKNLKNLKHQAIANALLNLLTSVDDWSQVEAPPEALGLAGGKGALKLEGSGNQARMFVQMTGDKEVDVTEFFNQLVTALGGSNKTVAMDLFDGVYGEILNEQVLLLEAARKRGLSDMSANTAFQRLRDFIGESKKDSDGNVEGHGYLSGWLDRFKNALNAPASAPKRSEEELSKIDIAWKQKAEELKGDTLLSPVLLEFDKLIIEKELNPELASVLIDLFQEVNSKGSLNKVNVGGTIIAITEDAQGRKRALITQDKWDEGVLGKLGGLWGAVKGDKSIWSDLSKAIDVTDQFAELAKISGTVDNKVLKVVTKKLEELNLPDKANEKNAIIRIIGLQDADEDEYLKSRLKTKLQAFMSKAKPAATDDDDDEDEPNPKKEEKAASSEAGSGGGGEGKEEAGEEEEGKEEEGEEEAGEEEEKETWERGTNPFG